MLNKALVCVLSIAGCLVLVAGCSQEEATPAPKSADSMNPSVGAPVGAGSAPGGETSTTKPAPPTNMGQKTATPGGK